MKLLFDQNISYRITRFLPESLFGDCQHVRSVGLNDCDDIEIWLFAKNNDFTIVTVDADFFDLAIVKGFPPKVIWFRTGNLTTSEISEILRLNSQRIKSFIDDNDSSCLEII